MPSLAEFTLTLRLRRDEASGRSWTVFRFATTREFQSFRYEIQVEDHFDPATRTIDFRIRGVTAPATLMPSAGSAIRELAYPELSGVYRVTMSGAKESAGFSFSADSGGLHLLDTDRVGFLDLVVEKGVELAGS
jgi:hypothetical protein